MISLSYSCKIINSVFFTKSKGCAPGIDVPLPTAVNTKGIKTLLANGLSTSPIKDAELTCVE